MDPNQQPQQGPAGGGAPAPGGGAGPQGGGADPGAQIQQLGMQYVSQGRPPELAQQLADAVVSAMGLDQAAAGQQGAAGGGGASGASGAAGAAGGASAGGAGGAGGSAGGPPSMAKGGKFKSAASKAQETAKRTATPAAPVLKIPGK